MDLLLIVLLIILVIFFGWFNHKKIKRSRRLYKIMGMYFNKLKDLPNADQNIAIQKLREVGITGIKGGEHYLRERLVYVCITIALFVIAMVLAIFGMLDIGDIKHHTRLTIIIILCAGAFKFYEFYKVAKLNYEVALIKNIP